MFPPSLQTRGWGLLDANTIYWTGAWLNMLAILAIAIGGVRQIPHARYERHKRLMLTACGLVGAFVASYAVKLGVLGREALELWEPRFVLVLRIHEACVALMLLGGGVAVWQAQRLGLPADLASAASVAGPIHSEPSLGADALARGLRIHRIAGFTALAGAAAGVLTAGYVLLGMFGRS